MSEVVFRLAGMDDVETLALLRWESELERHSERAPAVTRAQYVAAYASEIRPEMESGVCKAWIAEAAGEAVACVQFISWVMPPTPERLNRRRGFVTSVYTRPAYRRQGISRRLMTMLLEYARSIGTHRIILWASDVGRPLYESLGFANSRAMELNF